MPSSVSPGDEPDSPQPLVPPALLAAREGTGSAFPAALAAHARGAGALADAAAWWSGDDAVARLVGLELSAVLAGPASPWPVDDRGPALAQVARQAAAAAATGDADLRWAAAKALGAVGPSDGALEVLLTLVGDDDPDVRWQSVACLPLALGGAPEALEGAAGRSVVAALVAASRDEDTDVAEQAVFVLAEQLEPVGAAAGPAVAEALATALRREGPPELVALAGIGLARRGDSRAEPAVASALAQALEAVRSGADPDAAAELEDAWLAAAELLPQLAPLLADVRTARG